MVVDNPRNQAMKIYAIIELPADTQLTTHCPDMAALKTRIEAGISEAVMVSTFASDLPRVGILFGRPAELCTRCAAPLLPSGACSSKNCPVGRQPFRKPSAAKLAATIPGVTVASKLKRR